MFCHGVKAFAIDIRRAREAGVGECGVATDRDARPAPERARFRGHASSRSGFGTIVDFTVFIAMASATARPIPSSEKSNSVCMSSQG